jgi:hypothetical protein
MPCASDRGEGRRAGRTCLLACKRQKESMMNQERVNDQKKMDRSARELKTRQKWGE